MAASEYRVFNRRRARAVCIASNTPISSLLQAKFAGASPDGAEGFAAMAELLREHGADMTARAAVALGGADWLRAARRRLAGESDRGLGRPAYGGSAARQAGYAGAPSRAGIRPG
ncbi:hypothetical protein B4Q13_24900 [Lacticaseibacillus rhamnosus]